MKHFVEILTRLVMAIARWCDSAKSMIEAAFNFHSSFRWLLVV